MDKLTKIKETIEGLEHIEGVLLWWLEHIESVLLSKDDVDIVKTAISLLSDYAKWYDYRTPQRELYELKEKEKKEYGNISL